MEKEENENGDNFEKHWDEAVEHIVLAHSSLNSLTSTLSI